MIFIFFNSGSVNRDDESARSAMAFPVARRSDAESDRAVVAAKNGLNESKHFLSLQLFSTVNSRLIRMIHNVSP